MDEMSPAAKASKNIVAGRSDPTRRFSDRVDNYVKYRPGYPPQVLGHLHDVAGLTPASAVADVGSGTGISARPFLDYGCTVYGIEPNREMRQAADRLLQGFPMFHSIDGAAESTTLPSESVDLVTAGQAFHWFDPARASTEFRRVLRPGGKVALMWNCRKTIGTPFLEAYERLLLEFGIDYQKVRHEKIDAEALSTFYGRYSMAKFANHQLFDLEGLRGRLLSSSYAPGPGHQNHDPMMRKLDGLFERFEAGAGSTWITIRRCTSVSFEDGACSNEYAE
jgi:SAM-dependent methyltransferase